MNVRRILVPLDGSRLAEAALPMAASAAKALKARLVLVHVLERDAPERVHGEPHLTDASEARGYLESHASRLRGERLDAEVDVHKRPVRDVAVAIDEHVHELDADLIAMCAHGRTNLRDRGLGTIAEQILRGGSVPILLRTVRRPGDGGFRPRRLLVPIDFEHDVEEALDTARTFAKPYGAAVTLLTVPEPAPEPTRKLLPSASALAHEYERENAQRRLDEVAGQLRAAGFDANAIVADERPSEAIARASESLPAELIVLVTDVHGGLSSWYDPSTLQRLLALPELTLLLIKEL